MTTTRTERSLPLPPGSFGLPVVGETISFLRDSDFNEKRHKRYGPVFKTHIFGRPTVMMSGAEANQFLLTNDNRYFVIDWPHTTKVLLGPASLSVKVGGEHIKRRKLLAQAFQPRALAGYVPTMEAITRSYLNKWERTGELAWYPELRKYTFDGLCCKNLLRIENSLEKEVSYAATSKISAMNLTRSVTAPFATPLI